MVYSSTNVFYDAANQLIKIGNDLNSFTIGLIEASRINLTGIIRKSNVYGPKSAIYKIFTEKYGITPTNAAKVARGIFNKAYFKDQDIKKYAFVGKSVCNSTYKMALDAKDHIIQAEKDGLVNIIPILMIFNKSPHELKKDFGKSEWKKICKNTYSRNKRILSAVRLNPFHRTTDKVIFLNQFKSKWITAKMFNHLNVVMPKFGESTPVAKWSNEYSVKNGKRVLDYDPSTVVVLYEDAIRMCKTLEIKTPNFEKWSFGRLKDYHDNELSERMREYYKRTEEAKNKELIRTFNEAVSPYREKVFQTENFKATLIDTLDLLTEEGDAMHHCVRSYANMIAKGDYLVYSVTKDGERYSTLGLDRHGVGLWNVNQHYRHCNEQIEKCYSSEIRQIEEEILEYLFFESKVELNEVS